LWLRFAGFAAILAGAGVALEWTSETIGAEIGLGATAAGALLAGVVTSLPELVTAISAARAGAVDLAVGNAVGSSALDVTLLSFADAFYTEGTIFGLLDRAEFTLIGMSIGLTALIVFGLARRDVSDARRIAVRSYLMLVVYVVGVVVLVTGGG
jgi:cation:H+ antiporter